MVNLITNIISFFNSSENIYSVFGNRLTANIVPDGQDYPCGRVWEVVNDYQYHMLGGAGQRTVLQIDVYAETQSELDLAATAIADALSGYRGAIGDIEVGYVFLKNIKSEWNTVLRIYHKIMEVEIVSSET